MARCVRRMSTARAGRSLIIAGLVLILAGTAVDSGSPDLNAHPAGLWSLACFLLGLAALTGGVTIRWAVVGARPKTDEEGRVLDAADLVITAIHGHRNSR